MNLEFEVNVRTQPTAHDAFRVSVERRESEHNVLLDAITDYWRWCAEGCKPYYAAGVIRDSEPRQFFYDTYHDFVEYLPDEDCYRFSIRMSDSSEGDSWWKGKARIDGSRLDVFESRYAEV